MDYTDTIKYKSNMYIYKKYKILFVHIVKNVVCLYMCLYVYYMSVSQLSHPHKSLGPEFTMFSGL